MTAHTSFDVQPSTRFGAWVRRQGPAFWTGIAGAFLLFLASGSTVGLAEQPDMTVNFDDPELALQWGTVTVWIMRAAALLAFVAVLGSRVRRSRVLGALAALAGVAAVVATIFTLRAVDDSSLDYITSFGAWFAIAGGALMVVAGLALMRRS